MKAIADADGQFDNAPNFNFNDDKVKFDTNKVSNTNENYGSVSGFLPKLLLDKGIMPPPFLAGALSLPPHQKALIGKMGMNDKFP